MCLDTHAAAVGTWTGLTFNIPTAAVGTWTGLTFNIPPPLVMLLVCSPSSCMLQWIATARRCRSEAALPTPQCCTVTVQRRTRWAGDVAVRFPSALPISAARLCACT
eukprot:361895-Chlamydomonas_euryale.AAC.8